MRLIITDDERMTAAEQLALDEALLNLADQGSMPPTFRVWRFQDPVVILGRSSRYEHEINAEYCQRAGISVLRRCSGGASVVGGPGCLMYTAVISIEDNPALRKIDVAHDHVMNGLLQGVRRQFPDVERRGICDLAFRDQKFSGNSLRISRGHLLYHGTILHDADLDRVANCLAEAPRQPEYRRSRSHRQFITNLPCDVTRLRTDLPEAFGVDRQDPLFDVDFPIPVQDEAHRLLESRYARDDWHHRH